MDRGINSELEWWRSLKMKIGVICEGQTDFIAIGTFLTEELANLGHSVEFIAIQPAQDSTLPAGWTQVLFWLINNTIEHRIAAHIRGNSLFEGDDTEKVDAFLFQLDTDIIGETAFEEFLRGRGFVPPAGATPADRASAIEVLLKTISLYDAQTCAQKLLHIYAPIVESSETWIVGAAKMHPDPESLAGQNLCDAFGRVKSQVLNEPPLTTYGNINKRIGTRRKICSAVCANSSIVALCPHFVQIRDKIVSLV